MTEQGVAFGVTRGSVTSYLGVEYARALRWEAPGQAGRSGRANSSSIAPQEPVLAAVLIPGQAAASQAPPPLASKSLVSVAESSRRIETRAGARLSTRTRGS